MAEREKVIWEFQTQKKRQREDGKDKRLEIRKEGGAMDQEVQGRKWWSTRIMDTD